MQQAYWNSSKRHVYPANMITVLSLKNPPFSRCLRKCHFSIDRTNEIGKHESQYQCEWQKKNGKNSFATRFHYFIVDVPLEIHKWKKRVFFSIWIAFLVWAQCQEKTHSIHIKNSWFILHAKNGMAHQVNSTRCDVPMHASAFAHSYQVPQSRSLTEGMLEFAFHLVSSLLYQ